MLGRSSLLDVLIVGGGPAGLSAALWLGRCLRRVLLCDDGRPRNYASHGLHGYPTRDGILPGAFLAAARREIRKYATVRLTRATVEGVRAGADSFTAHIRGPGGARRRVRSRMVLLATGMEDRMPEIPGLLAHYGKGVFHCPYCDGWEVRNRPLAAIGDRTRVVGLALELRHWSKNVTVCTDGGPAFRPRESSRLRRNGIEVRREAIARLVGAPGRLTALAFRDGGRLPCAAVFFATAHRQSCSLARDLGCVLNRKGAVPVLRHGATRVPGLYVAGDASTNLQFVAIAVAEGAEAAVAMHEELRKKELL
jgi:thioredoxin reductase